MNELLHTVEHPWSKSVVKFEHSLGCPLGGGRGQFEACSGPNFRKSFVDLLCFCPGLSDGAFCIRRFASTMGQIAGVLSGVAKNAG